MEYLINYKIGTENVVLIDSDGHNKGKMPLKQAVMDAAKEDKVVIRISSGQDSSCPVAKIVDMNKFKYEQKKKEKEKAKLQRENAIHVKELFLRPATELFDIERVAKHANEFLQNGDKVKMTLKMRGREVTHRNLAEKVVDIFVSKLVIYKIESKQSTERNIILFLAKE